MQLQFNVFPAGNSQSRAVNGDLQNCSGRLEFGFTLRANTRDRRDTDYDDQSEHHSVLNGGRSVFRIDEFPDTANQTFHVHSQLTTSLTILGSVAVELPDEILRFAIRMTAFVSDEFANRTVDTFRPLKTHRQIPPGEASNAAPIL